jgi:hypothetical protein
LDLDLELRRIVVTRVLGIWDWYAKERADLFPAKAIFLKLDDAEAICWDCFLC